MQHLLQERRAVVHHPASGIESERMPKPRFYEAKFRIRVKDGKRMTKGFMRRVVMVRMESSSLTSYDLFTDSIKVRRVKGVAAAV